MASQNNLGSMYKLNYAVSPTIIMHLKKVILIYRKTQKKYFIVQVKIKIKNTTKNTFDRESWVTLLPIG
jgi:hypothetical protein